MKEWSRTQNAKPVGRPQKYPWDTWLNGRVNSALAGRDFHMSVPKFRNTLRAKAYHVGMSVSTWTHTIEEPGPTGPTQYWVDFRFVAKEDDVNWPGGNVTDDTVED